MADAGAVLPSPIRGRASDGALGLPRPGAVNVSCEPACGERPRYFLDACFLCQMPLRASRDIFMYRGDTPFCSEECRQEQILTDEAVEREIGSRRRRWQHHAGSSSVRQAAPSAGGQRLLAAAADVVAAS